MRVSAPPSRFLLLGRGFCSSWLSALWFINPENNSIPWCQASNMNLYCIVLKFGGYWVEVRNQGRKKYEGGKQKTLKLDKDLINLFVLREYVMLICPWLKDHAFELHSHIHGTSPKEYKLISSDIDLAELFRNSNEDRRVEVVISALRKLMLNQ